MKVFSSIYLSGCRVLMGRPLRSHWMEGTGSARKEHTNETDLVSMAIKSASSARTLPFTSKSRDRGPPKQIN